MTNHEILKERIKEVLGDRPYKMSLVQYDAALVKQAVSQGIDAHLQACFAPSRGDKYDWDGQRLNCEVSLESLPTLLRRLAEMGGEAEDLAGSILDSLDFEDSYEMLDNLLQD